jgi:pyridoxal phosphate enzyme (YggS family)
VSISENIENLRQTIPSGVTIIGVSKTRPAAEIMEAYDAGLLDFGENKVQELVEKKEDLPADLRWHFIGHLQSNKVRLLAPFIHMIHSLDSLNLMKEISREAIRHDRCIDCLLQYHIAMEETKFGMDEAEALEVAVAWSLGGFPGVRLAGVMGMASFISDEERIRSEFRSLVSHFDDLKQRFFRNEDFFKHISMGMSSDYLIAIQEGATMVRVGTSLFGSR